MEKYLNRNGLKPQIYTTLSSLPMGNNWRILSNEDYANNMHTRILIVYNVYLYLILAAKVSHRLNTPLEVTTTTTPVSTSPHPSDTGSQPPARRSTRHLDLDTGNVYNTSYEGLLLAN